jgi:hypothetical protein
MVLAPHRRITATAERGAHDGLQVLRTVAARRGMADTRITAASKALNGRVKNRQPFATSRASSSSTKNATITS